MATIALRGRVEFAAPGWLAVGDLLVIGLFVLLGEFRHYPTEVALARTPETALPFVVGWALCAWLVGAYAADALGSAWLASLRALVGWAGGAAVGLALRATPLFHGDVTPAFALVILTVGGTMLAAWRAGAAAYRRR